MSHNSKWWTTCVHVVKEPQTREERMSGNVLWMTSEVGK
jgi:hypothetical protein